MTNQDQEDKNGLTGASLDELPQALRIRFEAMLAAPPREAQRAARGRSTYLAQARSLSFQAAGKPAGLFDRWFGRLLIPLRRKEGRTMLLKLATAAMLVLVLIFGGAAATAYAAQDSLPSQPLYPIKIASEDLSMKLAEGEQARFQLALKYINRRGDEIVGLMARGDPLGEPLVRRFQQQMTYALYWAGGMPDGEMQGALEQYRASLVQQQQKMLQAKQQGASEAALLGAEILLQMYRQAAEQGLQDPAAFRQQLRSGNLYGMPEMPGPFGPPEAIPPSGDQTGPGPGGQPGEPGPVEPGPAEKPAGGPSDDKGNPAAGTPQAPGGGQGPGGAQSPSGSSGSPSNPGQAGPGAGGKGGGNKGGGGSLWPMPTPTPTSAP